MDEGQRVEEGRVGEMGHAQGRHIVGEEGGRGGEGGRGTGLEGGSELLLQGRHRAPANERKIGAPRPPESQVDGAEFGSPTSLFSLLFSN